MLSLVTRYKSRLVILIFCFWHFSPSLSAWAQEAKFADLLITNNAGQISVYARVTDCFTPGMEAAILAGVPITFTFFFDLYQERSYWWDKKITRRVLKQTLKYDNVKKIFFLTSTNSREAAAFQNLESAKRAIADLNGVTVFPVNDLQNDQSYYLKMKAKLDEFRLPLRMENLLFYVSAWDFETNWHIQKVTYQRMTAPQPR